MSPATSSVSRWLVPVAIVLGALLLASLARHRLVEPAELTAMCAAMSWDSPACVLRSLVVQAFAGQRIGLAALAFALLALLTRWRATALLALAVASAGLVLYSTSWAAPAVLLAALALPRPASSGDAW
jgi:hypothetical protein